MNSQLRLKMSIIPLLCCILALVDVENVIEDVENVLTTWPARAPFFNVVCGRIAKICKVLNGDAGTCMEIKKCKPLYDIHKKKHKTEEEHLYIQQAYCGNPNTSKFKVCCPDMTTWLEFRINPIIYPTNTFEFGSPNPGVPILTDKLNSVKPEIEMSKPNQIPAVPLTTVIGDDVNFKSKDNLPQEPIPSDVTINRQGCGRDSSSSNKIVGGDITAIDQYPWLVLLEYADGSLNCGGSLITSRYVLTAAHCILSSGGAPTIARLSEYNITSNPDIVEADGGGSEEISVKPVNVDRVFTHPNYSTTSANDIGLIRLAESVEPTDFIKTICLPTKDYVPEFKAESNFTVAGWGDDYLGKGFSDVKREVSIPYMDNSHCRRRHTDLIDDSIICAGGEEGRDSCKGDSGGPLMYESNQIFVSVGVVSRGPPKCGTESKPALYTNVYKYIDWIESVIKSNG